MLISFLFLGLFGFFLLGEDEGSRVEHSTSLGANGITERTKVDQEHKNEVFRFRIPIHR